MKIDATFLQQEDRELFIREFQDLRPNDYSRGALKALFDYLEEEGEQDYIYLNNEGAFLDVISICSDFSEYKDLKEFQSKYGTEYKTIEDIREKTTVIETPCTKGFIVRLKYYEDEYIS